MRNQDCENSGIEVRICPSGACGDSWGVVVLICHPARRARVTAIAFLSATLLPSLACAGNDANFVLYNQHTEEKGETEINLYSDFARVGGNEDNYVAQLLEIEHGVTDTWTAALYLEGVKIEDEDYTFGSFRFENRVRLFREETLLNPVLYAEYEQKEPESRYIRAITGRTDDEEEEEEEGTEHELETKLIIGHDLTDRFNVAFNWINEVNFDNGNWEFGYAAGLNYVLYRSAGGEEAEEKAEHREYAANSWDLEKLTLGVEFYGGLGDSVLGLTLDPDKTQQYTGINLLAQLENHLRFGVGGAFGLTQDSEDAILRLVAGYEFE